MAAKKRNFSVFFPSSRTRRGLPSSFIPGVPEAEQVTEGEEMALNAEWQPEEEEASLVLEEAGWVELIPPRI